MIGRLNGVEVEVDASWPEAGIRGDFRLRGPGGEVIADVFARDAEAVYSGPVRRHGGCCRVVVRVRFDALPTRGSDPDAPLRGSFRASVAPLATAPCP